MLMQFSHSRVDTFQQCPYKWKLHYVDGIETLPDDKPDNALYLGTALHTGLETGSVETAVKQYFSNYPIVTDEHINESIKLEAMIKKGLKIAPEGINELLISDHDFKGFMDLLVPITHEGGFKIYDLYDFKYSNNKQNYTDSDQLHIYKYFFEKCNPLCRIRNMYFLMVPKSKCKRIRGEDLMSYRQRLQLDLNTLEPELIPIEYDPNYVIRFLLQIKEILEAKEYPKKKTFLCRYCEYQNFCEKGEDFMLLPKNERRNLSGTTKKVVWVYGMPFSGKTTFANKFPDPLMLNTDGNIKFVDAPYISIKDEITKSGRMTNRKMAWEVFKEAVDELEKKENTFKTIVVDLLEDTYEFCRRYVCHEKGWDHESDDSFRAWDMVRTEFLSTLKRLMALDYENIVLISHMDTSKDITKKGGDKVTAIKPNIQDRIANKVAGMVDLVGRAVADDGNYVLSFKRNEVIFGGGRLTVKEQEIPLEYDAFCDLYAEANKNISERMFDKSKKSDTKETTMKEPVKEDSEPVEEPTKVEEPAKVEDPEPVETPAEETPVEDPKPVTHRRRRRTV